MSWKQSHFMEEMIEHHSLWLNGNLEIEIARYKTKSGNRWRMRIDSIAKYWPETTLEAATLDEAKKESMDITRSVFMGIIQVLDSATKL